MRALGRSPRRPYSAAPPSNPRALGHRQASCCPPSRARRQCPRIQGGPASRSRAIEQKSPLLNAEQNPPGKCPHRARVASSRSGAPARCPREATRGNDPRGTSPQIHGPPVRPGSRTRRFKQRGSRRLSVANVPDNRRHSLGAPVREEKGLLSMLRREASWACFARRR